MPCQPFCQSSTARGSSFFRAEQVDGFLSVFRFYIKDKDVNSRPFSVDKSLTTFQYKGFGHLKNAWQACRTAVEKM
jgi:hypothetical protein